MFSAISLVTIPLIITVVAWLEAARKSLYYLIDARIKSHKNGVMITVTEIVLILYTIAFLIAMIIVIGSILPHVEPLVAVLFLLISVYSAILLLLSKYTYKK